MPHLTPPQDEIESLRAHILQTEERLDRLDHALREKQHALKARLETLGTPLKAAGIETREDVERAFVQMNATEREALIRESHAPPPHQDEERGKRRLKFGRTV